MQKSLVQGNFPLCHTVWPVGGTKRNRAYSSVVQAVQRGHEGAEPGAGGERHVAVADHGGAYAVRAGLRRRHGQVDQLFRTAEQ